jgi:aryl-alcohol dehydrogenase-like predicted oxidoreductase
VETVLKAHAVHQVTCIQSECFLFTRDVEASLLTALRKSGIGFVPDSPLGRGSFTGKLTSRGDDIIPIPGMRYTKEGMKGVSR